MFTRIVDCTCKPGKAKDLCQTIEGKVLPTMRKLQGFKDEILLISQSDSDRVLAISFWNTRQDAERYHREQFPTNSRDGSQFVRVRSRGRDLRSCAFHLAPDHYQGRIIDDDPSPNNRGHAVRVAFPL